MAGPENKEIQEVGLGKAMHLPRADQAAIMSPDGAAQLPARPPEMKIPDKELEESRAKKELAEEKHIKEDIFKHRIEDIGVLVAKGEQERKALINTLFDGYAPEGNIRSKAEDFVNAKLDSAFIRQAADGALTQEALAKHLLECIAQMRSMGCSIQELAMLDSLEFQLMRILQHLNPNIRIQQQQTQEEMGRDDDASASGPDKVEDERDGGKDDFEELDTDAEYAPSPRSKKGKAKARDRRSRFRRWLARMMRVFRGQSLVIPAVARPQIKTTPQSRDRRFVLTVRIFGRVINAKTKVGIAGVKIISSVFGTVETSADGSYAFENVTHGITYSLAPLKAGYSFTPLSVKDIALNSREHNFSMVED